MSVPTPIVVCGPKAQASLQHLVVSSDGAGSYVETFTTYATVPALLTGIRGETKFMDGKMTEVATHTAYISYRNDILSTDRFYCNGNYYAIGMIVDPFNQVKLLKILLKLQPE